MTEQVTGERIFINTGATPTLPNTPGLAGSRFMVETDALMDQERLPEQLLIIGGGYIAAEFATTYAQFGAKVTMAIRNPRFMPFMDREAADAIYDALTDAGVDIRLGTTVTKVLDETTNATVTLVDENGETTLKADTILVATGRHANIAGLGLENTHVEVNDQGVVVDDFLRTAAPNVWALGDVRGGAQHTYISLDDSRIVLNQLRGDGHETLAQQAVTPSVVFTNPPMATIGLTQEDADRDGIAYRVGKIAVKSLPKSHIAGNTRGYMKTLVGNDDQILGATLFAVESNEMINLISMAMHNQLPYQVIRDQIFAHPTMSEGLNDLFEAIPDLAEA
jgi:pyruvate/2-oxoglutarate dehydrogenase complex dihydrolipoamide dehydrogenase (E3) component